MLIIQLETAVFLYSPRTLMSRSPFRTSFYSLRVFQELFHDCWVISFTNQCHQLHLHLRYCLYHQFGNKWHESGPNITTCLAKKHSDYASDQRHGARCYRKNNQWWRGVKRSYCVQGQVDDFQITAHPQRVISSSYTTTICQHIILCSLMHFFFLELNRDKKINPMSHY